MPIVLYEDRITIVVGAREFIFATICLIAAMVAVVVYATRKFSSMWSQSKKKELQNQAVAAVAQPPVPVIPTLTVPIVETTLGSRNVIDKFYLGYGADVRKRLHIFDDCRQVSLESRKHLKETYACITCLNRYHSESAV